MDRNRNRSDSYQYVLLETVVCPSILGDLSLAQGLVHKLQPFGYNEELLELREHLKERVFQIIEESLTSRQKEVIKLYLKGLTQLEIASRLSINQTSVHKVLRGNIDYKTTKKGNTSAKKRYGGAFKKISKICKTDKIIQDILQKIQEINECFEI